MPHSKPIVKPHRAPNPTSQAVTTRPLASLPKAPRQTPDVVAAERSKDKSKLLPTEPIPSKLIPSKLAPSKPVGNGKAPPIPVKKR